MFTSVLFSFDLIWLAACFARNGGRERRGIMLLLVFGSVFFVCVMAWPSRRKWPRIYHVYFLGLIKYCCIVLRIVVL